MQEIADYARNRILFFTPETITAKAAARLTSSAPRQYHIPAYQTCNVPVYPRLQRIVSVL